MLASMDNEITTLQVKNAKYEQMKQGMMQRLLTDKIRLVDNHQAEVKKYAVMDEPTYCSCAADYKQLSLKEHQYSKYGKRKTIGSLQRRTFKNTGATSKNSRSQSHFF